MSPTRFLYFVTFVDDYSRITWLYLMKNRYELFSHFRAIYAEIHTQFHVYIQSLRSDNAKEEKYPMSILLRMEWLRGKIDTSLKLPELNAGA